MLSILEKSYRKIKMNSLINPRHLVVNNNISYVNWFFGGRTNSYWFENFIKNNFPNCNKSIRFYSVFGKRKYVEENFKGIKIFFTPENLEKPIEGFKINAENTGYGKFFRKIYGDYNDFVLENMDLSIGFSELNKKNYMRFPLWIVIFFAPELSLEKIKGTIDNMNRAKNLLNAKDAVVIARHDVFGLRHKICNDIKYDLNISYAGKWNNTTDDLWQVYNNNKIEYMRNFRFNICAENINAPNYVTEKLFDAFLAGVIPIYYGANNIPEINVINQDRIIFWDFNGDNEENLKLIRQLKSNEDLYNKFINQPKLLNYAVEYVYEKMEELKNRMKELLN